MTGSEQRSDFQPWNQFRVRFIILLVLVLIILLLARSCYPPQPPPESLTVTPHITIVTATITTLTPTPIPKLPSDGGRPLVVIASYNTKPGLVTPENEFILELHLVNQGQIAARNIILTIPVGNFIPVETGGVLSVGELASREIREFTQPLVATSLLAVSNIATLEANISYTDAHGNAFSEVFTIAINLVAPPTDTATPTYTSTFTPTASAAVTPRSCTGFGKVRGSFWIVAGCDTLSRISQVTGISLQRLLAANQEIRDPDLIYPNQLIRLPLR